MKSIDQLKQEQAKQLAKLERELKVAESMPVPPDRVMATHAEPWVTYKVKGIRPAIDLLKQFVVVPMTTRRSGCLYVKPLEQFKETEQETTEGSYAVSLEVNQGEGFGPDVEFSFFARVESVGLVRVNVDVQGPEYIGKYSRLGARASESRDTFGRLTARSFSPNPALNGYFDKVISWASGDTGPVKTSARIEYFLCSDIQGNDAPGASLSHALGQLVNLADEFEPEQESGEG